MSWRYKLNACDTRLMRETWHHSTVFLLRLEDPIQSNTPPSLSRYNGLLGVWGYLG